MRIGRSTAPGISNTVDQATWRAKYAACVVDWNALSPEQQAAYQSDADERKITAFNQFMSICLLEAPPPPEYEDFTTYTEVDVGADRIQRTALHVDHLAYNNETTYLYKDKGVDHFGDFVHDVDVRSDFAVQYCSTCFWFLSNNVGGYQEHVSNSWEVFMVAIGRSDATYVRRIRLIYRLGATVDTDQYAPIAANTWYYLRIERSGTTLTCKIYSDSARLTLLDTLTITVSATPQRYIYPCNSDNTTSAYYQNADIEKLKLA